MTDRVAASFYLLYFAVAVLGFVGWIKNLVKIAAWNESMGMLVVRIIGAFIAPLGGLLGWL